MQPEILVETSDEDGAKHLALVSVPNLADAAEAIGRLRSGHSIRDGFALLLVADASAAATEDVSALASTSIGSGLFWVSTWGPACERVHDIFDEVDVARLETQPAGFYDAVMSTWHDDEPLEETLGFFWNAASPGPPRPGRALRLVVVVGTPDVESVVRTFAAEERQGQRG